MNSLSYFSHLMVSFVATYLLHSTVLLAACWLFIRCSRTTSHFLVERMWKLAAVLGLLTTVLQTGTGASYVMELVWIAPPASSSRRAVVDLPVERLRQTERNWHVSMTSSPRSTDRPVTDAKSTENRESIRTALGHEANHRLRVKNAETPDRCWRGRSTSRPSPLHWNTPFPLSRRRNRAR